MARRGRRYTTAATPSRRKKRPSARRRASAQPRKRRPSVRRRASAQPRKGARQDAARQAAKPAGRNGQPIRAARVVQPPRARRDRRTAGIPGPVTGARVQLRYGELLQRAVSHYAPAAVLINPEFEILSMQGPLVDYLEFPPGQPTRNLLSLARPGLRARIGALVHTAMRERAAVIDDAAHVRRNGRLFPCLLTARPIGESQEARGSLLIVFQDRPKADGDAASATHESPVL